MVEENRPNVKKDAVLRLDIVLALISLVLAWCAIYVLISTDSYRCACDYGICNDNYPVGNGGVDVNFLMSQAENFTETSEFCNTKGYHSGQVSGSRIYCGGEGRYEYFRVMTDFVEYLYEKYRK
jgi:hypothetical protein